MSLQEVRKHAETIDILATQRGASLNETYDPAWEQCLLAVRSLLAALPDPDVDPLDADYTQYFRAEDAIKERDELAARIDKAVAVGHNNNCIFCGFKDRALKSYEENK